MKDYFAPSRERGEALGIIIHYEWGLKNQEKLQRSILSAEFQKRLDSPIVNSLWTELANKYPKLKELNIYSDSRYHIVLGCVSQFNYDDIEYFIKVGWTDRPKDLEERTESLRNRFGYGSLQWVPSEKTIDKIEDSLLKIAA